MGLQIFLFALVIGTLLLITLPTVISVFKKYKNANGNVQNTDTFMRHFCYFVPYSEQEISEKLALRNMYDETEYIYDAEQNVITFQSAEYGGPARYELQFTACNSGTMLKVSQMDLIASQNYFPYLQNAFWSKKINAKPTAFFD
ncbi:MAG: hypothetical protein Q4E21_07175 [Clostridia bacterium]|nr:hypothetical protein [Clostridia bacterium]